MKLVVIHDLKEPNGKTIKENNLERKHKYSLGKLVEMDSGVRMFVSGHKRDCDGSPLYCLSYENDPWQWEHNNCYLCGFGEGSLKELINE